MVEYTIKDMIINTEDTRVVSAIGKKVYYGDNPYDLLYDIKKGYPKIGTLEGISESKIYNSFKIEEDKCFLHQCIVIKKEEPKEYVPFDNIEEFIKASLEHNKNHVLSSTGIWLEEKTFDKNGELGDYYIYNIDSFDMINNIVFSGETNFNFSQLLKSKATFLDGTPCGKLKE